MKKSIYIPKPDKTGIYNTQPREKLNPVCILAEQSNFIDWLGKHAVWLGHKRCEFPADFKRNRIRSSRKQSIKYIFTKTHRHKPNCIYFTEVIGIKLQYHQAAKQHLAQSPMKKLRNAVHVRFVAPPACHFSPSF